MKKFKNKYCVNSIRIHGYDYSKPGAYFITICTNNRKCLFGIIKNGEIILNDGGKIAHLCWSEIPSHYPDVMLDEFVIMPNHIHGIIFINYSSDNKNDKIVETQNIVSLQLSPQLQTQLQFHQQLSSQLQTQSQFHQQLSFKQTKSNNVNQFQHIIPHSIGSIVRGFKIGVTKWFRNNTTINKLWQKNYYEHIVRNEIELNRIRKYIQNNPMKWKDDENYC